MKREVGSAIAAAPRAERALRAWGARGDLRVVVLAGGNGTRLQAFTREVLGSDRPNQFCRIIGTRPMLRHTWDRAARLVAPNRMRRIGSRRTCGRR